MRFKIAGLLLAAALLVALCSSPSLALNATKIYGITERNLTIDLGPGFEINKAA